MKMGELVVGGPRLALFQPSKERLDQLGAWFHAEYPSLLRFAYFVSGSSHAAEDLVQDAFVRLYRSSGRVDDASFKAYARKTILNLARSGFLRRTREQRSMMKERDAVSQLADGTARDEMWRAILSLPARQRAVVAIRYYEDMKEADIAVVLGISVGSVKKHTDRALEALRARLGEERRS